MRFTLPLFVVLFAAVSYGQSIIAPKTGTGKFPAEFWSEMGPGVTGDQGFKLRSRGIRETSDSLFELWIKILPNKTAVFNRQYSLPAETAYALQSVTVNCRSRFVKVDNTILYNSADELVKGSVAKLTPAANRNAVRSGSISGAVYESVCVKP